MQKLCYILFIFHFASFSQKQVNASLKDSIAITVETLFGIDTFNTLYYTTEDNAFLKKTNDTLIAYNNFQLGKITSANVFNPLKINLFYQDFNTVIILDNRLAEIAKLDFNTQNPYKNVSHISTGFSNTLWLFNQDNQHLELYDYNTNTVQVKTLPIPSNVLDLKSDYNYCYLLTENYLYIYNYFGSLIQKHKNEGFSNMAFSKGHLVLKAGNSLFLMAKDNLEIKPISGIKKSISQFLVTNQSLYIYCNQKLFTYHLKID